MTYSVDVSYEYQSVKSKLLKLSLLFSFILTIIIVADVLLITLSKEDYQVSMIIAIIITTLFSWFAIYFFTCIYSDVNHRYRYYKGYESGLKNEEEIVFLKQGDELCFVNGLYVYPIIVRYIYNLRCEDKTIFTLQEKLTFEQGDKLTITTYQRVLISAEKHQ